MNGWRTKTFVAAFAIIVAVCCSQTTRPPFPTTTGTRNVERVSNRGTKFVLGFGPQLNSVISNTGSNRLYLSSHQTADVRVYMPSVLDRSFRVDQGKVTVVTLPAKARMSSTGMDGGTKEKKGIVLTSRIPFSVYALQMTDKTSEGYLGLPTTFLGTSYVVPSYTPISRSFIQVVATENVKVWFDLQIGGGGTLDYNNVTYSSDDTLNIRLANLESFLLQSFHDLTGTVVSSDKRVAVFSGNDCTFVPKNTPPCNHLVEQIPPFSRLGSMFLTSPIEGRTVGDIYRVLAAYGQTSVSVNGALRAFIDAGKFYEIADSTNPIEITSSNPSLLVQYSKGHAGDKSGYGPFMTVVPPKDQWTNDYALEIPESLSGQDFEGFLNIVVETKLRIGLVVKSTTLTDQFNWTRVGNTKFSATSLSLYGRFHYVFHSSPLVNFLAIFYGKSDGKAFGFPAGVVGVSTINVACSQTVQSPGDGFDNDCDAKIDEELFNGVDDDGDGLVDEDVAVPAPTLNIPSNKTVAMCDSDASILSPDSTGRADALAHNLCEIRGRTEVSYKDIVSNKTNCSYVVERRWKVQDACRNVVRGSQYIFVKTPILPNVRFPSDVTYTCRKMDYITKYYTGDAEILSGECTRTDIFSEDSAIGSCKHQETKHRRKWTVRNECKKQSRIQTITLLPRGGIRLLKNYIAIFTINNMLFTDQLKNTQSEPFIQLASRLLKIVEETFMSSKVGSLFVGADVLEFRNGSVKPHIRMRFANSSQISQSALSTDLGGYLLEGNEFHVSDLNIEDYDECLKPEDNECDKNADCSNIIGSYRCVCLQGFVGDGIVCQAPPSVTVANRFREAAPDKNITLRCEADGVPSPVFTWITPQGDEVSSNTSIKTSIVLDDSTEEFRGKHVQKDGSLLIYGTRDEDAGIYKCMARNIMGSDSGQVNLTIRNDFVQVDVVITLIDETFSEQLEDTTSVKYQKLEQAVKLELTIQFQNMTGFERIEILGFSNGSVKVAFRVVVKVDKDERDPKVQTKRVANIIKLKVETGFVGKLKVKGTVELKEKPPPPRDIKFSNLKEDEVRIAWSFPELYEMYSISGYSLQYRKFATNQWNVFDTVRGSNRRLDGLGPGTAYLVRLKTNNPYGASEPSGTVEFQTPKEEGSSMLVLSILLPIIFLVILALAAFFVYKRWRGRKAKAGYITTDGEGDHMEMTLPAPASNNRYAFVGGANDEGAVSQNINVSFTGRQLPRDSIKLGKVLGEGEFGLVTKADLLEEDGQSVPCAVKTLKRNATESDLKDLLNELEIMQSAGKHPNIVNLIGACIHDGPLMVVVEFAEHGQLLRHLRNHRTQNYDDMNEYTLDISLVERLRVAIDVANGMTHLSKMKCVHRDLAARNVLLGEGMVAKVSDFGLSRDIYTDNVYQKQTGGKLPAKWMAIESLECGTYTSQSDVWSFGVLLWEIETGGCTPYAGLNMKTLLDELKNGHRLEMPRYCSFELYSIMSRCWNPDPDQRPTFVNLCEELEQLSQSQEDYLNPEYDKQPMYANA